jgi:hypothetical protein
MLIKRYRFKELLRSKMGDTGGRLQLLNTIFKTYSRRGQGIGRKEKLKNMKVP